MKSKLLDLPLISIIIPVYNCEEYLKDCISSVVHQDYPELEIILVNDGSTDNSGKLCDKFAEEYADSRRSIKVIHKKNGGACFARRDGVLLAKADYVAFVDGDDYIDSDFCLNLMNDIIENEADVATSGFVYTSSGTGYMDSVQEGLYTGEKKEYLNSIVIYEPESEMGGIIMSVCMKVYKKELFLDSIKKIDIRLEQFEDLAYCYGPIIEAHSVYVENVAYYHYRNNPNSVTRKRKNDRFQKAQQSFLFERQLYSGYGKKYLDQFDCVAMRFYYFYLWDEFKNSKLPIKELFTNWKNIRNDSLFIDITENAMNKKIKTKQVRFIRYFITGNDLYFWLYFNIINMLYILNAKIKTLIRKIVSFFLC
ncbi:glycosyltransferase family 2 protein [Butyrivibrio hungatei]|uniref:Glycosyl transferase GT2 family n=1 Tax=Butyrivibrio hungatei TaxID=185008 RepID=A0A1D9NZ36_9FIRM|nr:glycosyltransferase [Butyrivibrio hungatei]AOZ95481.1 glycosyl transferase GT2 family [Butyrivibrio hungatei]